MRRLAVLAALALVLAGCGSAVDISGPDPAFRQLRCTAGEEGSGMVVLLAQSVRDLPAVPCLFSMPTEWTMEEFEPADGRTHIRLAGVGASVTFDLDLVGRCDRRGAAETTGGPPPPAGLRRYDRTSNTGDRYRADRYFVADGGCVAFHFDGSGRRADQNAEDIMGMFGFLTRVEIDDAVARNTDGRLRLDPES